MADGLSGFETPSYIYGAVFAFFLIMSLVIEKVQRAVYREVLLNAWVVGYTGTGIHRTPTGEIRTKRPSGDNVEHIVSVFGRKDAPRLL